MNTIPLVSFCILSYNQEDYIKEAVLSAMKQDYPNMEVIISDDNSSDKTYRIIEQTVNNNNTIHKIILNKNKSNLGLIKHLNFVLENLVHGEYVLLMGGDDISTSNRSSLTMDYFNKYPKVGGVVFSYDIINSSGSFIRRVQSKRDRIYNMTSTKWLSSSSFVIGGLALAFRKKYYDFFGPLGDCHTEDSTIRFRILLTSDFLYSAKIGLQYRRHASNITSADNLYTLRTDNISNQYYKDLNLAYSHCLVDKQLYRLADNKIEWYKAERNLREKSHISSSFLYKVKCHLIIKLLNVKYWLRCQFFKF